MATMISITPTVASRVADASSATDTDPLGGSSRLTQLLTRMEKLLTEPYKFDVFRENAINFGILVTYRQTWKPEEYQVGDLVKTIPMAPKEVVRYTTKMVTKKTRAQKELEDRLETRRSSPASMSRASGQSTSTYSSTPRRSVGPWPSRSHPFRIAGRRIRASCRVASRKFSKSGIGAGSSAWGATPTTRSPATVTVNAPQCDRCGSVRAPSMGVSSICVMIPTSRRAG